MEHAFAFLLHDSESNTTGVIDILAATPVVDKLTSHSLTLTHILLTHQHGGHTGSVEELMSKHSANLIGGETDENWFLPLDQTAVESRLVMNVFGNTYRHIAFYFSGTGAVASSYSLVTLDSGSVYG